MGQFWAFGGNFRESPPDIPKNSGNFDAPGTPKMPERMLAFLGRPYCFPVFLSHKPSKFQKIELVF